MFESLTRQDDDPLLALIGLFRADGRPDKVDLGVGVYRAEDGSTPIFRAVKAAERTIWHAEETKAYVGPAGDLGFLSGVWELVCGAGNVSRPVAALQTVGGSGALRVAADLVRRSGRGRVWVGTPTWSNHAPIFEAAEVRVETYPFFHTPSQTVHLDAMIAALSRAAPGDVALLQACCHNPTGVSLSGETWERIGRVLEERGVVPLVDVAYLGLGRGPEEDVDGLRRLLARVPEALIVVSASKSFGLYRERVGAIYAVAASAAAADTVRSNLLRLARGNYSMPPAHGAAIVRTILADAALRADWASELATMRRRISGLREALAARLAQRWPALAAMADQEGMFSLLPLAEAGILRLRAEYGVYMPTSGRINVAGLRTADAERAARGIVEA